MNTNFTSKGKSASNHTSPIFFSEGGYHGKRSVAPKPLSRSAWGAGWLVSGHPYRRDEAVNPIQPAFQLFHGSGVGNAHVFIRSESFAWYQGDVRLRQKLLRELERGSDAVGKPTEIFG